MKTLFKTLIPILLSVSCAAPVEKKGNEQAERAEELNAQQRTAEDRVVEPMVVSQSNPVEEPQTPASVEKPDLGLVGKWQQHRQGSPVDSGITFTFCSAGTAVLVEEGVESKFEKFAVFDEKAPSRLSLFPNERGQRQWLFRRLDLETFEVAEPEPCPANKSCYAPSFERLRTLRFERISTVATCE